MTADSCTWVQLSRLPRGWVYYLSTHSLLPLSHHWKYYQKIYILGSSMIPYWICHTSTGPPQTVCGRTCGPPGLFMAAISGPPLLRCTTVCAIINSTFGFLFYYVSNPYSLLPFGFICTLRVNKKCYNARGQPRSQAHGVKALH